MDYRIEYKGLKGKIKNNRKLEFKNAVLKIFKRYLKQHDLSDIDEIELLEELLDTNKTKHIIVNNPDLGLVPQLLLDFIVTAEDEESSYSFILFPRIDIRYTLGREYCEILINVKAINDFLDI